MPLPTARFPGAVAVASDLLLQKNRDNSQVLPTLAAPMAPGDTSFTVVTGTGAQLPTDNFVVTIDNEIIFVTSRAGDVCTVGTRGFEGTTAASHLAAAGVNAFVTALAHNQAASEISAIESTLGVNLGNLAPIGVVSSGLLARYKMLPTETPGALVDYSGNGNNATGTVGTAPTIIPGSGGVQFNGNGAVSLPAALNAARTIMLFVQFHTNDFPGPLAPALQSLIQGNDSTFVSGIGKICGITLRGGPNAPADTWGNKSFGARQIRSLLAQNSNLYANSTVGIVEGITTVALVQDTTDHIYIHGVEQRYFQSTFASAGLQTAGNYQLGGCALGTGLQSFLTYLTGKIYYALFYNRVLSAQEIAQNHAALGFEMGQRGINLVLGGGTLQTGGVSNLANLSDLSPQVSFRGDSITVAPNNPKWFDLLTPAAVGGQKIQLNNLGLSGDGLGSAVAPTTPMENDSIIRPGGSGNLIVEWLGVNDGLSLLARMGLIRQFCQNRRVLGARAVVTTITSNGNELESGNQGGISVLPTGTDVACISIRRNWKYFADGLCDINSVPKLGAIGAHNDAAYFPDGLHPSGLANQFLVAPLMTRTIDRMFGRNDFTAASTIKANTGPVFVQGNNIGGNANSFGYFTYFTENQPGDLLIAVISDGVLPTSVTDSNNNNWQLLQTGRSNGVIYYATNCKGGPNQVLFNFGTNATLRATFAEYSGVSGAPFTFKANANGTGTAWNSGSITPLVNGSLILGVGFALANPGTITPGAGFTLNVAPSGGADFAFLESQVQTVAGAISATATSSISSQWDLTVIAFSPSTGASYTMQDADLYLKADPSAGSLVITLPPATGITTQRVKIKNLQTSGVNTVTLVPTFFGITSVVANGTTAVFTVPDVTKFIVGMTIIVIGCTTSGLNATYTITAIAIVSGSSGTITVASAVTVTESEPSTAQMINELIDGATSALVANNTELTLESVMNSNTAIKGCNWVSVTD